MIAPGTVGFGAEIMNRFRSADGRATTVTADALLLSGLASMVTADEVRVLVNAPAPLACATKILLAPVLVPRVGMVQVSTPAPLVLMAPTVGVLDTYERPGG